MNSNLPSRRVIVLGASNVARSFPTILCTARAMWSEPIDFMVALGHGRSYGQDSVFLGRKISGIFPCALWQDLQARRPLPTTALVTDIGNDLLYGISPPRILEWVAGCVDRLAEIGAATIVTELPLCSLQKLGALRFQFFRTLLFPGSRLTLATALARAAEVNVGLVELAKQRKTTVISASDAWYGFDPIHLKRSASAGAWQTILSSWGDRQSTRTMRPRGVWERAYLSCLTPHERAIFGMRQRATQPSGRLGDGSTISLY
jgi:hypothetical protein